MKKIEMKYAVELNEQEIEFIRKALEADVDAAEKEIEKITDEIQNGKKPMEEKRKMSERLASKRQERVDKMVLMKEIGGLVGVHYCGI